MLKYLQRIWRWGWGRTFSIVPPTSFLKFGMAFVPKFAPMATFSIISLLCHFTYQLLPASPFSTFLLLFFTVELFGNWFLFFRTKSFIEISSANSEVCPGLSHSEWRELRYCPNCKIYKPERSHHCSLCDRCIHQRDHHCFFLGTCVGGNNLCYFVIFCFYACIGCFFSAKKLHEYYSQMYVRSFLSNQFHYYFYPVTLIHWYNGQAALAEVGWVGLLYVAVATVIFTGFCVGQQLFYVLRGQTAYEYNKGLLMVHRSALHNFLHVFGRYWVLQWLMPIPKVSSSNSIQNNALKII